MEIVKDFLKIISIHAPHEGERLGYGFIAEWSVEFQSTLPTRGSDVRNMQH